MLDRAADNLRVRDAGKHPALAPLAERFRALHALFEKRKDGDSVFGLPKVKVITHAPRKHKEKGNGFGFGKVGPDDVTRTLSARYYKDGSEILVKRGKTGNARPRRWTG